MWPRPSVPTICGKSGGNGKLSLKFAEAFVFGKRGFQKIGELLPTAFNFVGDIDQIGFFNIAIIALQPLPFARHEIGFSSFKIRIDMPFGMENLIALCGADSGPLLKLAEYFGLRGLGHATAGSLRIL